MTASWSNSDLSRIFQKKYFGKTTNYYPYPVVSNTTSTNTGSQSSSNKWLAPVLGTILGLLVVGIVLFTILFVRRRKLLRRNNSVSNGSTSGNSSNRYIRWANGIPPVVNEEKSSPSIISTEAMDHPSHLSNPSNETNITSPLVSELGGRPRYEMPAAQPTQPAKAPVELPTPYHDQDHHYSYPNNIDYAYDQPALGGKSSSSAYSSDANHSSPFSPDDVNRDSGISHGDVSQISSLPSNSNSPLLSPIRNSRADDDIPPVPRIPRHMRQNSTMSSGIVSPLTPVDEGKARFQFD